MNDDHDMPIAICPDLRFRVHPFCGHRGGGLIQKTPEDKEALKKCQGQVKRLRPIKKLKKDKKGIKKLRKLKKRRKKKSGKRQLKRRTHLTLRRNGK